MTAITKAEYWLLDAARVGSVPLGYLHSAEAIGEGLNRLLHGLTLTERYEAFGALAESQLVEITHISREKWRLLPALSAHEAQQLYIVGGPYDYRLTTHGGAIWEAHSSPDWTRFLDAHYELDEGEIAAADLELVEQYARLQHEWGAGAVVASSMQRDRLIPWQATYWKVLPSGYRLRFRTRPHPPTIPASLASLRWHAALERWYTPPFWTLTSPC